MGVKTIQIAKKKQNGDPDKWYTFPGNSGDFTMETEQLDDNIYGVRFSSTQPGLLSWNVSTNAMYRGFAGYEAIVRTVKEAKNLAGEEVIAVTGDNKSIQIKDGNKRILNPSEKIEFSEPNPAINPIVSIDYLFGIITFQANISNLATVAITGGEYYEMEAIGCANSFSLSQTADTRDVTCFENSCRKILPGLRSVSLDLTGFYRKSNNFFEKVSGRGETVIEIIPDGASATAYGTTTQDLSATSTCRGFFHPYNLNQSGDVGGDENETITFNLSTRSEDEVANFENFDFVPFGWAHGNETKISNAVKTALDAWQKEEEIWVRYMPEGKAEEIRQGKGYVTDASVEQSVDGMSEFSITIEGNGCPGNPADSQAAFVPVN